MKFAPKIKPAGKGKYEVHYTPSEAGDHLITVIVGGEPVNGSPFKVPVKLNHAKKVIATGPGLVNATAGKQTEFLISNAPDEAVAKTVVTVTAPDKSKVPAKLESQGGGKYHVTYTPLVPGDHEVSIKVDDREIPNAPYMCSVKTNYAPQMKVEGLDPSVELKALIATEFKVVGPPGLKCNQLGTLTVEVEGPKHKETPNVKPGEGIWDVQFAPSVPGTYKVHVKLDGEHVPGSTFVINVRRANDQELIDNSKTDPRTCHCQPPEPNMFDKRFCRACQKWVFDYYMHQIGVKKMDGVKDSNGFKPRE